MGCKCDTIVCINDPLSSALDTDVLGQRHEDEFRQWRGVGTRRGVRKNVVVNFRFGRSAGSSELSRIRRAVARQMPAHGLTPPAGLYAPQRPVFSRDSLGLVQSEDGQEGEFT
jgi:hypothetical protein